MGLIVVLECGLGIVISKKIYKCIFNPTAIFNIWWMIISFLSIFGISGLRVPRNSTYLYIFLSILFFNIGSYLIYFISSKKIMKNNLNKKLKLSIKNIKVKQLISLNIIYIIIIFPYTFKSINIIRENGFEYLRLLAFNESSEFINSTMIHALFQYIVSPFFLIVSILGIILSFKENRLNILLKISFLNSILEAITFGGRTPISRIIEFYIIIYMLIRLNNKVKIKIKKRFILILLIPIIYLTIKRGGSNFNFLNNFAVYYVGSFSLLDIYLSNSEFLFINNYLTGRVFLGGLINPIIAISSKLFNFDYKLYGGDYIITSMTAITQNIGDGIYMNAAPTWVYHLLRDLGIWGLIIYPIIFGFIVNFMYLVMLRKRNLFSIAMMAYLIYTMIKTTSGWMFLFISTWIGMIYLFYFIKGENLNESNT
ncbi:O-antigen polymerase [Clostridium mediterraneense]|uniref:O-antigen polymerase n=1 Tax=Clostridium mediterraneense TaxID=1805472 RepID=UPI0008373363|nr:O-antigen polymerase [Clostridium mediterraneense]